MCSVSLFAWRKMSTASPLHGDFDEEDVADAGVNSDMHTNSQVRLRYSGKDMNESASNRINLLRTFTCTSVGWVMVHGAIKTTIPLVIVLYSRY